MTRGLAPARVYEKSREFCSRESGFSTQCDHAGTGKFMLIRTVSVALLLLAVACDPEEGGAARQPGKTAAVAGKAPVTGVPAAPLSAIDARPRAAGEADGPADRAAYSSCLLGCDDAKVAHADKAACRFNCEPTGTAAAGAAAAPAVVESDPVEYVVDCLGRCYSGGKRSEACTGACKSAVATLPAAPSAGVLDSLGTCLDACHLGGHVSETNRATCGLNCSQAARVAGPAQPAVAAGPRL